MCNKCCVIRTMLYIGNEVNDHALQAIQCVRPDHIHHMLYNPNIHH